MDRGIVGTKLDWGSCMDVKHRQRGRQAGFTLIEALVTLAVFGIGTLALMQLAPRATQFANRGRLLSEATSLAQAKLEELRAMPPEDLELQAGLHVDPTSPIRGSFTRRWVVTQDQPLAGMRRVEVQVSYPTVSTDSMAAVVTYF